MDLMKILYILSCWKLIIPMHHICRRVHFHIHLSSSYSYGQKQVLVFELQVKEQENSVKTLWIGTKVKSLLYLHHPHVRSSTTKFQIKRNSRPQRDPFYFYLFYVLSWVLVNGKINVKSADLATGCAVELPGGVHKHDHVCSWKDW